VLDWRRFVLAERSLRAYVVYESEQTTVLKKMSCATAMLVGGFFPLVVSAAFC